MAIMSDVSLTPCECQPTEFPFVCPRHGCRKTVHWHKLCRERPAYFELWEQGSGPGQPLPGDAAAGNGAAPRMAQKAWSLATSIAAFVADGCSTIAHDVFRTRLETCDGCDRRRDNKCLECGCYLPIKARWRVMQCPLGKWPEEVK
jgi:hypothetical protein